MKDRLALILLVACYLFMAIAIVSISSCTAKHLSPKTTTQK